MELVEHFITKERAPVNSFAALRAAIDTDLHRHITDRMHTRVAGACDARMKKWLVNGHNGVMRPMREQEHMRLEIKARTMDEAIVEWTKLVKFKKVKQLVVNHVVLVGRKQACW